MIMLMTVCKKWSNNNTPLLFTFGELKGRTKLKIREKVINQDFNVSWYFFTKRKICEVEFS